MLCRNFFYCYAECHYPERCYVEWRGAIDYIKKHYIIDIRLIFMLHQGILTEGESSVQLTSLYKLVYIRSFLY